MQEKDFVSYEYKTVSVKAKEQFKTADMYEAFGWEVTAVSTSLDGVTLSLKRNRKIPHKPELSRLERQAENVLHTIDNLESSKTRFASIFSYTFGIIATLVFGGAMCLVMLYENSIPALIGGIVLGVLGIFLCSVNYPIYRKMVAQKSKTVLPVIDDSEEKLANILEEGNDLLKTAVI